MNIYDVAACMAMVRIPCRLQMSPLTPIERRPGSVEPDWIVVSPCASATRASEIFSSLLSFLLLLCFPFPLFFPALSRSGGGSGKFGWWKSGVLDWLHIFGICISVKCWSVDHCCTHPFTKPNKSRPSGNSPVLKPSLPSYRGTCILARSSVHHE